MLFLFLIGVKKLLAHILYSVDADMEDYGFEYSEEEQEEQDVDIENQYYNSKGISNNYYNQRFLLGCEFGYVCLLLGFK